MIMTDCFVDEFNGSDWLGRIGWVGVVGLGLVWGLLVARMMVMVVMVMVMVMVVVVGWVWFGWFGLVEFFFFFGKVRFCCSRQAIWSP